MHKKMFGSDARPSDLANQKTLIISDEKMKDIIKIGASLGAGLRGNLLAGKGTIGADEDALELVNARLELVRIFNTASSFN